MGAEWDRLFRTYGPGSGRPKTPSIQANEEGKWQPGAVYGGRAKQPRCMRCGKLIGRGTGTCKCPEPVRNTRQDEAGYQMQFWHEAWAREALRVLKPGGHLLAMGGTRTYHRLVCAIEDAGFEIKETLQWIHGQGFPKGGGIVPKLSPRQQQIRAAHGLIPKAGIETQQRWGRFATSVKPSHEPIVLARKSLSKKSVRAQFFEHYPVEEYGTGALNIGLTRVGISPERSNPQRVAHHNDASGTPASSGDTPQFGGVRSLSVEQLRGELRSIVAALRSCSISDTSLSRNEGTQGDSQPVADPFDQTLLSRLYPNGVLCGLNWSKVLNSQGGCPACRGLCDEHIRRVQEAAQESPPLLADALADIDQVLFEHIHSHCEDNDRPSNCGALARISALLDLLLSNTSIPYSEPRHSTGRWPSNLLLSHVGGPNGCQRVGVKRVRGNQRANKGNHGGVFGNGQPITNEQWQSADPDGFETTEAWECARDEAGNYICPVALLDEQSGTSKSKRADRGRGLTSNGSHDGWKRASHEAYPTQGIRGHSDEGGASRYFLNLPPENSVEFYDSSLDVGAGFLYQAKASRAERTCNGTVECSHPTVKPLALMKWLVTLVTPPGGACLDPFLGSGTTGVACKELGFDFIGIEQDASYLEIARLRIAHASVPDERQGEATHPVQFVAPQPKPQSPASLPERKKSKQSEYQEVLDLFGEAEEALRINKEDS